MKTKLILFWAVSMLFAGSHPVSAQDVRAAVDSLSFIDHPTRHLNHPILLAQAKIPGLMVYQDRNPNGKVTYYLRGFNRIQGNNPLVIVDGIIESDLDFLDPNSVVSIKVHKSLATSSMYGLRGADGVIEIRTNRLNNEVQTKNYLNVNYAGYFARSSKSKNVPVMNREAYIEAGGNDLGSKTVWQNEVSRVAISNVYDLKIDGKLNDLNYVASANLGSSDGILDKSGFERTSFRFGAIHNSFANKVSISANAYYSKRNEALSFVESFRYATVYYPTAPIFHDNGAYWEAILFDNFNPVAILEQNQNEAEREEKGMAITVKITPVEQLEVLSSYSKVSQDSFQGQFYSSESFFRGLNNNGLAIRTNSDIEFQALRNEVRFTLPQSSNRIQIYSGFNYYDEFGSRSELRLSDFNGDPQDYRLSNNEVNQITRSSIETPTIKNTTFYIGGVVNSNAVVLESRIRKECYNVLGNPNQCNWFGDVSGSIDLKEFISIEQLDELGLTISTAKTAIHPGFFGAALSQSIVDQSTQNEQFIRDPSPELEISTINEYSLGFRGATLNNSLTFGIEFYRRDIKDVIAEQFISASESITGAQIRNENSLDLKSKGMEAGISFSNQIFEKGRMRSAFSLSRSKITIQRFYVEESLRGYPGAPGQGSTQMLRLAVGDKIGQIWGTVFDRVAEGGETETFTFGEGQEYAHTYASGEPIFKDLNGDGIKKTAMYQALDTDADFKELGNAYPDFEFGWTNTVFFGALTAEAHFRGAVGHSKINLNRLFYEPVDRGSISSYNRVQTDKAADRINGSYFSSLYVERADFVTLDYISLGYNIDLSTIKAIKSLRVSAILEDVFTITKYTGVSPEPVFSDYGPVDNGGFGNANSDFLAPGIDRRLNYLPARSILFGISIDF